MVNLTKIYNSKVRNDIAIEVLYEANHADTGEPFVVFRNINERDKIFLLPKEQFIKNECDQGDRLKTSASNVNSIYFPDIHYTQKMQPLIDGNKFSKSVKSMITLLVNNDIVPGDLFIELKTDDDIENLVLRKIQEYSHGEDIEEIFHLIQIWGGITGRGVYIFEKPFNWGTIAPHYQSLVDRCLSTRELSDESINVLLAAINKFNTSVKHMGVSYITKHIRYWLYQSLGNNALPIYDSIMANCVMQKRSAELRHLSEYWHAMIIKSKQLNISLMALERQIFKYASTFNK